MLSATGAVAGLSMLMAHDSSDTPAQRPTGPATSSPEQGAGLPIGSSLAAASVSAPLEAAGQQPRTARAGLAGAATHAAGSSGASAQSPGRQGEPTGSWGSSDWQTAVEQTVADPQPTQQPRGRHGNGSAGDGHDRGGGNGHGY